MVGSYLVQVTRKAKLLLQQWLWVSHFPLKASVYVGGTLRFGLPSALKIACPCAFAHAFLSVSSFLSLSCVCRNPAHLKPMLKWHLLKAIPETPLSDLEVGIYSL